MQYNDALPLLKTGDLLLMRGKSWFSWLISFSGPYTHVAVVLRSTVELHQGDIVTIIEAMEGKGVRMMPLNSYLKDCCKRGVLVDWFGMRLDANQIDKTKFVDYLLRTWGEDYSFWQQFFYSFFKPIRWFRKTLGLSVAYASRPFCSWNVAAAATYAGFQPDKALPQNPEQDTPTDVSRFTAWYRIAPLEAST